MTVNNNELIFFFMLFKINQNLDQKSFYSLNSGSTLLEKVKFQLQLRFLFGFLLLRHSEFFPSEA